MSKNTKTKNIKKSYIITGIVLAVVAVFATTQVLIFKKSVEDDVLKVTAEERYVSEFQEKQVDLASEVLISKPQQLASENVDPEDKKGEIIVVEERQVVKFETELTGTEKQEIETKYKVEFTQEASENGVYTIKSNENSQVDLLKTEKQAVVEVDKPVKLLSQAMDWGVERVGATQVWIDSTGVGSVVAVIDTGVQLDHPDLSQNIIQGFDFVDSDYVPADDNGHGTHVSGIVAAVNNDQGVVGVSYSTQIMPIRVLNGDGYGYLSDVAKGIYYATDNGADVINLSLEADEGSDILKQAINYAYNNGVLVVAAGGNSSAESCAYPAAYESAVCVVATDQDNKLASFSNKGGELAAPGVSNLSTYVGGRYAYLSGTSMAAPHIAGSAATIFSYCGDCSAIEVRQILQESSIDLGEEGYDSLFGYGLVDLVSAFYLMQPEAEVIPEEPVDENQDPTIEEQPEEEVPNDDGTGGDNNDDSTAPPEEENPVEEEPTQDPGDTPNQEEDIEEDVPPTEDPTDEEENPIEEEPEEEQPEEEQNSDPEEEPPVEEQPEEEVPEEESEDVPDKEDEGVDEPERDQERQEDEDHDKDEKKNIPGILEQELVLLEPEIEEKKKKNNDSDEQNRNPVSRYELDEYKDVEIKFALDPELEGSKLEKIIVYVDNELVYSTEEQEGEYTLKEGDLTSNQYIVKIVAEYTDKTKNMEILIVDLTKLKTKERNNRASPRNPKIKSVLGVSSKFSY